MPDHLWDWWNDDQQRQWLQVQPWDNADPWHQYGIVASRTGHQQDHNWDQWNRWNADAMAGIDGRRGHSGMMNRRGTFTKVRLQNGTEIILRKPGATVVAHWNSG